MMAENRKAKVEVKLDQPQLARGRYVAVRQVVLYCSAEEQSFIAFFRASSNILNQLISFHQDYINRNFEC
jgi:hypothetical protein